MYLKLYIITAFEIFFDACSVQRRQECIKRREKLAREIARVEDPACLCSRFYDSYYQMMFLSTFTPRSLVYLNLEVIMRIFGRVQVLITARRMLSGTGEVAQKI